MDANNPKHTECSPNMATNSWRTPQTQTRERTVSHISNVIKQHYPFDDPARIKRIALTLEQKIFTAATSQDDYLQKISRKLSSIKEADKNDSLHSLTSVPPSTHMNQQPVVPVQKQAVQTMPASLPTHGRQPQPPASLPTHGRQPQQESNIHKFVSQGQSPPANLLEHPRLIHEEIKQAVPMSDSSFEAQPLTFQRKQILQSRNILPAQSANLKLEQGQIDENTWREEIYQWLQTLKRLFLPEVKDMGNKVYASLRQIASSPQPQMAAEIQKRSKMFHNLKQFIILLEIAKHKIEPKYKQPIAKAEKELIDFFRTQELKRSMSSQHHKQLPVPNMNAFQQSSSPHNQNPLQSDTDMLHSLQLNQQGTTKSHSGEQQYPQGNMMRQLANQKRQRELENKQQPFELHAHQNPGNHMNLTEAMKVKQEMGNTGTPMQHHLSRLQQVKHETPSPVSSPQLLQVPSIQPSQNPLPKKKQKNLQTSPEKNGTLAGVQQESGAGPAAATSLQISTPQLSASPVLESSTNKDNNPAIVSECNPQESSVIEQPIQRLLRVVNSMSPATLSASVEALTECHLQEMYFPTAFLIRGGTSDSKISEMESVTTFPERTMIKANNSLMEEIKTINRQLISTVVEICDENYNSATAAYFTDDSQAKIVKCSFIDLANMNFISGHASENLSLIQPLKLLIPGTYPGRSPLVLDKSSTLPRHGDGASTINEDLSGKAVSKLKLYLRRFEEPLSLEKIAKAWDTCAHSVFREYAEQLGGGSFSSRIRWMPMIQNLLKAHQTWQQTVGGLNKPRSSARRLLAICMQ